MFRQNFEVIKERGLIDAFREGKPSVSQAYTIQKYILLSQIEKVLCEETAQQHAATLQKINILKVYKEFILTSDIDKWRVELSNYPNINDEEIKHIHNTCTNLYNLESNFQAIPINPSYTVNERQKIQYEGYILIGKAEHILSYVESTAELAPSYNNFVPIINACKNLFLLKISYEEFLLLLQNNINNKVWNYPWMEEFKNEVIQVYSGTKHPLKYADKWLGAYQGKHNKQRE